MNVIVTAGPTRERIDSVRFITNASSGKMGFAVATAAAAAGHHVTLLSGPVCIAPPAGCNMVPFVTLAELAAALDERFDQCDALVMSAAVGDFRLESPLAGKISRKDGPISLRLVPTEDVLASLGRRKRAGQIIVSFAVEEGPTAAIEAKARKEMAAKNADFVVVNTPAAMAADDSYAAILSADQTLLPWGHRPKDILAGEIVRRMGDRSRIL